MFFKCEKIQTSLYEEDNIVVEMGRGVITIKHLPQWMLGKPLQIIIRNEENGEVLMNEYDEFRLPIEYSFNLPNGFYKLDLGYEFNNKIYGANVGKGFVFQVESGVAYALLPPPFAINKEVYDNAIRESITMYNGMATAYTEFIPDEIVQLASQITKKGFSAYEKILLIHDWIAENIYYDYDSCDNGQFVYNGIEPLRILGLKRCVCQGFAKLSITMLHALGIPAVEQYCYSICDAEATIFDWIKEEHWKNSLNHVFTLAYADNRWIMMDVTWDCDNHYKDGKYLKNVTGRGVSHEFFDRTLAAFSYTHRLFDYNEYVESIRE